jgi:hypothetical protein
MAVGYQKINGEKRRLFSSVGELVSAPPKMSVFHPPIAASYEANDMFYPGIGATPALNDLGVDSEGFWPIKAGDVFIVTPPNIQCTSTVQLIFRIMVYTEAKVELAVPDTYSTRVGPATSPYYYDNTSTGNAPLFFRANVNGYARLAIIFRQAISGIALPTSGSGSVQIAKIEQFVPDIVAKKGALVSGGAFQFDEDGNGYTENYSTGEVRCGTWIDGKPLYKRSVLIPSLVLPVDTWQSIGGFGSIASLDTVVKMLISGSLSCSDLQARKNTTDDRLQLLTNTAINVSNGILTVWYTKTTD